MIFRSIFLVTICEMLFALHLSRIYFRNRANCDEVIQPVHSTKRNAVHRLVIVGVLYRLDFYVLYVYLYRLDSTNR